MKIKERLIRLLPTYTYLPIVLLLTIHLFAYNGTRLITANFHHYSVATAIDEWVPLIPAFIVIYVLAYAQWGLGLIFIARESREVCYRFFSGEILAKLICIGFFLLLPTAFVRPEITGNDIFSKLTALIYGADSPDNLFPSLHCLESWICFRGTLMLKKAGKGAKISSLVFTLLVFSSTVCVKQHLFLDIIGGVAVCEIGLFLSKVTHADRLLRRINRPFDRQTDTPLYKKEGE